MPMDGTILGTEIANTILHPDAPAEVRAEVIKLWQSIGNAIVVHIQTNATVPPGILVATAGTAAAQAGATTTPGTVL